MLSSGIPRQDLFFTSKVPPNSLSFDQAKANVDATLNETKLDYIDRPDITTWCKQRGGVCEAWGPLARGKKFGDARLKAITDRTGATEAQVLVRWSLQMGFVPLPKSTTEARIFENSGVSNFSLTPDEMKSLDTGEYLGTGWDPTTTTD